MTSSATLGYPRIGPDRELKRATESYWADDLTGEELRAVGRDLRARAWDAQDEAGIDHLPSNDFSLYDQVLDTVALLGAVPERYRWSGDTVDLDTYFAMARGAQTDELDVQAMEMTKWFDTNYHYIVPEFHPGQEFRLASEKPFREFREARERGHVTRPVLIGPVSFLLLGKATEENFDPLDAHLDAVVDVYGEVLERLAELGAEWIQMDEPCFVEDRSDTERAALREAYARLEEAADVRLMVQTYFGHVGESWETLMELPVDGVGLDFVRGRDEHLDLLESRGVPGDTHLSVGLVDGRNVWINDLEGSLDLLERVSRSVDPDRLVISPSCSLMHVPLDAAREQQLDDELRSWLAFARQKLDELSILAEGTREGRDAVDGTLADNRRALQDRRSSDRIRNPAVRRRTRGLDAEGAGRDTPFAERRARQGERLGLPALPTTVIGSFPQHDEVRQKRRAHRSGDLDREAYESFLEEEIRRCVEMQEDAGIDVVTHGEFERNDMVEYFAEQFEGFAFTEHGWVQSYGSRYVKPPILFGDVQRPDPVTVRWWEHAASCTDRPVKAMLTGPVTMLQWSFVRDDQSRSETTYQLALAVRDEVADLEEAGAPVIQVDEPALREGLPLRRDEWDAYLEWAVNAFRLTTGGVAPETQVHTHMCYSEFNDIIEHIAGMDADVLLIENARSDAELLEVFRDFDYDRDIGPGVYDIHSPRVPPVEEMAEMIRASLSVLPAGRLWVNPDCGLKTRGYAEVVPALENMVEAARRAREEIEQTVGATAG